MADLPAFMAEKLKYNLAIANALILENQKFTSDPMERKRFGEAT
jgi:hypothetical protein